jgi:hypothetical protein
MGNQGSATASTFRHISNDYELAIRSSKELEFILETEFGSHGKGLHEKITNASSALSPKLIKSMRYLATIRNKLIHEVGYHEIPNREAFLQQFEEAYHELISIVNARRRKKNYPESQGCCIS